MQRKIGPRAVCGQTHVPWSGVASAAEAAVSALLLQQRSKRAKDRRWKKKRRWSRKDYCLAVRCMVAVSAARSRWAREVEALFARAPDPLP